MASRLKIDQQHDQQNHGAGHQRQADARFERVHGIQGEPELPLEQHQRGQYQTDRQQTCSTRVSGH